MSYIRLCLIYSLIIRIITVLLYILGIYSLTLINFLIIYYIVIPIICFNIDINNIYIYKLALLNNSIFLIILFNPFINISLFPKIV